MSTLKHYYNTEAAWRAIYAPVKYRHGPRCTCEPCTTARNAKLEAELKVIMAQRPTLAARTMQRGETTGRVAPRIMRAANARNRYSMG